MIIKRNIFNKLASDISEPEVAILLGARQVGKTTLLRLIESEAKSRGLSTAYYDLESSRDMSLLSGDQAAVEKVLCGGTRVVLIDEFHYLKNASKIFKSLYDRHLPLKIYASGSSSLEIHKHLKESLAGRFKRSIVFPLSLQEAEHAPGCTFDTYLQWGGMPGLLHRETPESKMELLENIVNTYIAKDIKGIIREENVRAFNAMLYWLAQHQGSVVVASSLARETGLGESTVARHLEIMSQTYVCHIVNSYARNLSNELKKSKKAYLFDLGIRNSLLKDFRSAAERDDRGVLYESFVYLHLFRQLKPNMEIRFWRTKKGSEVDFVLLKNRIPLPVEVKSNPAEMSVPPGMKAFLKAYPESPYGVVFNGAVEGEKDAEGRKVFFRRWESAQDMEYLQKPF